MSLHGSETDRTYEAAGLGTPVRRGSRPAIVVVDLTRGFTDPAFPMGADLTSVVEATAELVRAADVPVVYTTIGFAPAELAALAWLDKAPGLRSLTLDGPAVELDPRLPFTEAHHLVMKKGASAFFGTGLASLLASLRVDTVIVCGATTSGCVRATVVDALQSGYPVLVPRECVGDRADGPAQASLFDIQAKYGDVLSLAETLEYLANG
jgi:maleamate amidohydrolase